MQSVRSEVEEPLSARMRDHSAGIDMDDANEEVGNRKIRPYGRRNPITMTR